MRSGQEVRMYAVGFMTLLLAGAPGQRQLVDRVVAVVNDDVITLSDVHRAAQPFLEHNQTEEKKQALYKDVLDQLIGEQLIAQQVTEAKLDVTEEEVDRAMKDIMRQHNIDEGQLRSAVESRGMSMGQYK